jgi:predicted small lipoprotein YifL
MVRGLRWLAVLAAAAALSGCGAGGEGATPRSPDVRAAARPDEPAPSESRDSAYFSQDRPDPRAFLRNLEAASDRLQVTGRTAKYASMTVGCVPCEGFVKTVEDAYAAGATVDFTGSTIVRIVKAQGSDSVYLLTKDVAPTIVRHGDGRLEKYPGGRTTFRYILEPDGASWNVAHFFVEPS